MTTPTTAVGDRRPFAQGSKRAPGVYFEDVFGPPVPDVRSGVPLFVGFVEKTPDYPKVASRWIALNRWTPELFGEGFFGRPVRGGFLAYSVRGFFENGGSHCFVLPIRLDEGGLRAGGDALEKVFRPGGILEDLEHADLVCVPDAAMLARGESGAAEVWKLQGRVLEYCTRMKDRFAILDSIAGLDEGKYRGQDEDRMAIRTAVAQSQSLSSDAGALYFPWVRVYALNSRDYSASSGNAFPGGVTRHVAPTGRDEPLGVLVPPSGHVAGIYARSDNRVGVHKAPANESLAGVIDVGIDLAGEEQGYLNTSGVNCIRNFPGRGIRVWGARTLSQQPAWRYVNVRRVFLSLIRWMEQDLRDLVFEPNGPPLWERVRQRLRAYCYEWFRRGALKGSGPEQAFFVKCDAETNPEEEREAGRLVAEIGLAVEVPAEFVIVRITQSVAGTDVTVPGIVASSTALGG